MDNKGRSASSPALPSKHTCCVLSFQKPLLQNQLNLLEESSGAHQHWLHHSVSSDEKGVTDHLNGTNAKKLAIVWKAKSIAPFCRPVKRTQLGAHTDIINTTLSFAAG